MKYIVLFCSVRNYLLYNYLFDLAPLNDIIQPFTSNLNTLQNSMFTNRIHIHYTYILLTKIGICMCTLYVRVYKCLYIIICIQ